MDIPASTTATETTEPTSAFLRDDFLRISFGVGLESLGGITFALVSFLEGSGFLGIVFSGLFAAEGLTEALFGLLGSTRPLLTGF